MSLFMKKDISCQFFKPVKSSLGLGLLSIFLPLFFLVACEDSNEPGSSNKNANWQQKQGKPIQKAVPVEVINAQLDTATSHYVTTTTLSPSSDARINARTSGVVREILHEEGDDVKSGELLLLLENDDQRLHLKQARQQLANANREYQRLSKMKKSGLAPANDWEASEIAFHLATTELELAELALSHTRIVAPFDGRVVWRDVDLGAHVGQGDLLFRMMSIRPLLAKIYIPANRIGIVAKGDPVDLTLDGFTSPLSAAVDLISPIVDPATGTIKVTIEIADYPVRVRPGDFAEVRIVTEQRQNALLVPSVSIIEERDQYYLYVEEDGKAIRKNVQTGFVIDTMTEIRSGISNKDKIIIKGQRNLNEGSLVTLYSKDESSKQKKLANHKDSEKSLEQKIRKKGMKKNSPDKEKNKKVGS